MKRIIFIVLLFLFTLPAVLYAQGGPPIFPDGPEQTPIDGGLGILAALGGAYALKKLRERE